LAKDVGAGVFANLFDQIRVIEEAACDLGVHDLKWVLAIRVRR
jgi:hypothetical protein